jgi:hypothetical protein
MNITGTLPSDKLPTFLLKPNLTPKDPNTRVYVSRHIFIAEKCSFNKQLFEKTKSLQGSLQGSFT